MKRIIICLLIVQSCFSQEKSICNPVAFNGKSANAFSIALPQNVDYVKQLFGAKFELERFGASKMSHENYNAYFQIKIPAISSSSLDFYYLIDEIKSDNGSSVKVNILVSKGYDNFINQETDPEATESVLVALNDIGTSVHRKNFEIQIAKKEEEVQIEKQKLIFIEQELSSLMSEKKELDNKISKTNTMLSSQAITTKELGNALQKLKMTLSDFEKRTTHKSKDTLKTISKQ